MTLTINEKMVKASKNSIIIKLATKAGYKLAIHNGFHVKALCPKCEEKGLEILQTSGITGGYTELPWVNFKTALVFKAGNGINQNKYIKIYACPCGWRKFIAPPEEKPKCKTVGCNVVLPKGRKSYCYNCRKYKGGTKVDQSPKEEGSKVTM